MFTKARAGLAVLAISAGALAGPLALAAHAEMSGGPAKDEVCEVTQRDFLRDSQNLATDVRYGNTQAAVDDVNAMTSDYSVAASAGCDWTVGLVLPTPPSHTGPVVVTPIRPL